MQRGLLPLGVTNNHRVLTQPETRITTLIGYLSSAPAIILQSALTDFNTPGGEELHHIFDQFNLLLNLMDAAHGRENAMLNLFSIIGYSASNTADYWVNYFTDAIPGLISQDEHDRATGLVRQWERAVARQ
jgi:hypothetical protein